MTATQLTWAATAAVIALTWSAPPARAAELQACAQGHLDACFALLARPRLDAGRRAAIEFHLAEVEKLVLACRAGDAAACRTMAEKHPRLPPDMQPNGKPPTQ